jgi:hypothetical protein
VASNSNGKLFLPIKRRKTFSILFLRPQPDNRKSTIFLENILNESIFYQKLICLETNDVLYSIILRGFDILFDFIFNYFNVFLYIRNFD